MTSTARTTLHFFFEQFFFFIYFSYLCAYLPSLLSWEMYDAKFVVFLHDLRCIILVASVDVALKASVAFATSFVLCLLRLVVHRNLMGGSLCFTLVHFASLPLQFLCSRTWEAFGANINCVRLLAVLCCSLSSIETVRLPQV